MLHKSVTYSKVQQEKLHFQEVRHARSIYMKIFKKYQKRHNCLNLYIQGKIRKISNHLTNCMRRELTGKISSQTFPFDSHPIHTIQSTCLLFRYIVQTPQTLVFIHSIHNANMHMGSIRLHISIQFLSSLFFHWLEEKHSVLIKSADDGMMTFNAQNVCSIHNRYVFCIMPITY